MVTRWYEEPGDFELDGILMCGVCGSAKECAYETDDGRTLLYPVVHQHQLDAGLLDREESGAERALRIAFNAEACWPSWAEDVRGATLDGFSGDADALAECRAFVDDFPANRSVGRGLVLYGRLGTGKTYLAGAVCNALLRDGWKCRFTSLREVRRLAETWGGEQQQVERLASQDLVVLDDLFRERRTDWARELAFTVVDALWQARVPVIVTTNVTASTLRRPPDDVAAVVERVKHRSQRVEVAGQNMRMVTAS